MKKKLLILILSMTVIFSACTSTEEKTGEELRKENEIINSQESEENTKNNIEDNDETDENENNTEENLSEETDDELEDSEEEIEEDVDPTLEEEMGLLEENSDYISIIRMSQTGSDGKEVHVIEDLKGSLKNIVIPDIPNLQPNYEYLVFLMDSQTGDITLTDMNRGLIKLEDRNDERLEIIRDILSPTEEETE